MFDTEITQNSLNRRRHGWERERKNERKDEGMSPMITSKVNANKTDPRRRSNEHSAQIHYSVNLWDLTWPNILASGD